MTLNKESKDGYHRYTSDLGSWQVSIDVDLSGSRDYSKAEELRRELEDVVARHLVGRGFGYTGSDYPVAVIVSRLIRESDYIEVGDTFDHDHDDEESADETSD